MSIYEKLGRIQEKLFVPKGQKNNFGNYSYRSCEDILKAVKPICSGEKVVLTITNEAVVVGSWNYIEATAKLIDLESGEILESKAQAREEENKKGCDTSQITGACSSYARKYALAGLFCIDNEKDSDATNTHEDKEPKKASAKIDALPHTITPQQIEIITKAYGKDLPKFLEFHHVTAIQELSMETASNVIENVIKKRGKA